jgi:hypothetical protein
MAIRLKWSETTERLAKEESKLPELQARVHVAKVEYDKVVFPTPSATVCFTVLGESGDPRVAGERTEGDFGKGCAERVGG